MASSFQSHRPRYKSLFQHPFGWTQLFFSKKIFVFGVFLLANFLGIYYFVSIVKSRDETKKFQIVIYPTVDVHESSKSLSGVNSTNTLFHRLVNIRKKYPMEYKNSDLKPETMSHGEIRKKQTVKIPDTNLLKQTVTVSKTAKASLPPKVFKKEHPINNYPHSLGHLNQTLRTDSKRKTNESNVMIASPPVYLCVHLSAGLGNRLYMFASAYGLAKSKGMKLVVIGELETLKSAFKMEGDYGTDGKLCDGSLHITETECCKVSPNIANLPNNKNVSISGYLQSYKYFDSYSHELRRIFTFRDEVLKEAKTKLNQLLSQKYVGGAKIATYNRTLVGIQIRRGDYLTTDSKKFGYKTAPKKYIFKAQDYIRKKYVNVAFVACSNDVKWTQGVLGGQKDAIIAPMGSANVDMALLSLMDHVIITVGTYGYWSAWLNRKNGTVIYYKDFFSPNSAFSRGFAHPNTDTYYPHWIGM